MRNNTIAIRRKFLRGAVIKSVFDYRFNSNKHTFLLFFLLLMLLFRSVCHQVSDQADKLDLATFIISRRFAHLFKWASPGQSVLTDLP